MLVVEDGTGLANAESYLAVVDATAYATKFGKTFQGEVVALEAALRNATQYIDSFYRFRGCKLTTTQALQWPRDVCTMTDLGLTWPVARLQQACAELAIRSLAGDLRTDQPDAAVTRETVGPITVEYAYSANAGQVRYAVVDDLLSPYTGGGRNSLRLERA